MKEENFRQGDVLLVKTEDKIVGNLRKDLVLAEGEATGHKHQVSTGQALLYGDMGGDMMLDVQSKSALLTYEEHGQMKLEKGVYKVMIQQEYTPQGVRPVMD